MSEEKKANNGVLAPEIKRSGPLANIASGLHSLWQGMKVTLGYFVRPSTVVTQQYPENRETLKLPERFRAQLTMIHDEQGQHKCSGCGICQDACPNFSINVINRKNPVTGKNELDRYVWRMDSCTFCNACVQVCPFGTLKMEGNFESAVYDRRLFVYTLNKYAGPTSTLLAKVADPEEKKKLMEARERYSGPIPLCGTSLAGVSAGGLKELLKKAEPQGGMTAAEKAEAQAAELAGAGKEN